MWKQGAWDGLSALLGRVNDLEIKKVKATFFATISGGTTSGTVSKPAGAGSDVDFIMDEWGTATDALLSTLANGKPTFRSPEDSGGNTITTTFNTAGEFTFSGTPDPADAVALVYVYTCLLGNFDVTESLLEAELLDWVKPHADFHVDGTDDIRGATAAQKGLATAAQITALGANVIKLAGIEAGADVTDAVNVASSIHGVVGQATPLNADEIGLVVKTTEGPWVLKVLTWANTKATLKTYFDTLYQAVSTAVLKATFTTKGDILVTTGASTPIRLAVGGTNDHVLTVASGEASGIKWAAVGTNDYVKVSDVKAYNVAGGTFATGAWRTRDINTEDSDSATICSIASNQITLEAGTYTCSISCPGYNVNQHKACLYNITDSAIELIGITAYSNSTYYAQTRALVVGKFTIATQKTFEVRHLAKSTQTSNGFGVITDVAGSDSIYTVAEFRRINT